jgi:AcrR family transcriptional regulator
MADQQMTTAHKRREQIIEAAAAIISEKGLPSLSLSAIERRARMSRGQLTYYFPTKEAILLAVFDRVLCRMYERLGRPEDEPGIEGCWWDWVQHLMTRLIMESPVSPEFSGLQYTFLAQSTHRADFRQRLAQLYGEWRGHMSEGIAKEVAADGSARPVSPPALATVVQALLHGLGMQLAADPDAFDRLEAVELCLDMLSTYVWGRPRKATSRGRRPPLHFSRGLQNGSARVRRNGRSQRPVPARRG